MSNGSNPNAKPWWKSRLIILMAATLLGTWSAFFLKEVSFSIAVGNSMAALAGILLRFEDLNKLPPKD